LLFFFPNNKQCHAVRHIVVFAVLFPKQEAMPVRHIAVFAVPFPKHQAMLEDNKK
jgi:hypothetical protein